MSNLPTNSEVAVKLPDAQQVSEVGVVLAAGEGKRFGTPKVLADNGRWLASAVTALHQGGCQDVVVVLGAAAQKMTERCHPDETRPLTVREYARAGYAGRPGHPVVIARRHWPAMLDMLAGDEGAGPFLRSREDVVVVDCADLCSGVDIDQR